MKLTKTQAKREWKKGDWCYCYYDLYQIKGIDIDNYISISTGYIETSGDIDNMFPVTMLNKLISETYRSNYDRISKSKINGLNFPDINGHIEALWFDCMEEAQGLDRWNDKDMKKAEIILEKHYKILHDFVNNVLSIISKCRNSSVNGVRLFG